MDNMFTLPSQSGNRGGRADIATLHDLERASCKKISRPSCIWAPYPW